MLIEPQLLGSMREEMLFYSKIYSQRLSVNLLKTGWMKEWVNGQINKYFIPGCMLSAFWLLQYICILSSMPGAEGTKRNLTCSRPRGMLFICFGVFFFFFLYSYVLLALFIITKTWKQSKCQLGNRLTNYKLRYIHTKEEYSALQRNTWWLWATAWRHPQCSFPL